MFTDETYDYALTDFAASGRTLPVPALLTQIMGVADWVGE